jgi:hypothetical protein
MKALILLIGESFRAGGWLSRTRGDPSSYKEQKEACMSHIKFIEEANLDAEIMLVSYDTPYTQEMLEWYKPRLVKWKIFEGRAIGFDAVYRQAIDLVEDWDKYDFIHFFRIDLFLKPYFTEVFRVSDKITYSFVSDPLPLLENFPRLNDMMLYVPKKHFAILKKRIVILHDLWVWGVLQRCRITKDVAVYIDSIHDSNTQRCWNPLFRIVNRPESCTCNWEGWRTPGFWKHPVLIDE